MISLILCIFIVGYCAITLEQTIKINKAASALVTGVLCWAIYILGSQDHDAVARLLELRMGELSGILFFLLGSMVIVELIDAHDGFDLSVAYNTIALFTQSRLFAIPHRCRVFSIAWRALRGASRK